MASSRKKARARSSLVTSGRLPLILTVLSIITVIVIGFLHFSLSPSSNIEVDRDALVEALNEDLQLATKPLQDQNFPLDQIFGHSPIWGTLNSGHYFGLKLSSPESIETSLAWFKNELNQGGRLDIRHLCDQNDNLNFYSWIRHDFWSFGEQIIQDGNIEIKTSFQKNPVNHLEWVARVDVEFPETSKAIKPVSLIQYITTNHKDDKLEVVKPGSHLSNPIDESLLELRGFSQDIGDFEMSMKHLSNHDKDGFVLSKYHAGYIDKDRYSISSYLQGSMTAVKLNGTRLYVLSSQPKRNQRDERRLNQHNIVAYQLVLDRPGSLLITFKQADSAYSSFEEFVINYQSNMDKKIQNFDAKFAQTFPINIPANIDNSTRTAMDRLAKVSLSNMVGSVGYFYGLSFIGTSTNVNKVAPYGPIQLLTAVPSRSFFPRGFLWDEGFHNLLISQWDPDISNKIIKSWFDIMNINGWVPREVILGLESMRRVPHEFIVQRITNANPPAMFIVIERMLDKGVLSDSTFEQIYPKLKVWYNWFNMTQFGSRPNTFRWRGRDELSVNMLNPKTLTSGLDDYPRSSHPSPDEYHIDLRCWMTLAARTLTKLARRKGDSEFVERISSEAELLSNNVLLDELHWSDEHEMYCDFGHNTEKAELVLVTKTRASSNDRRQPETYQVLERHSTGHPKFGCVPEFGYVSLFPMLLNILDPHSAKLGLLLDKIRDENELWSPYGIRSLSKSSRYYNKYNTEHDKPYWRGAIWLNMNYLILSSLKSYSNLDGPYKERCANLFVELKDNLVVNVLREFSRTNYIWENYDDQNGQGKGSHPFTGWSSLILLVMSSDLE